MKKEESNSKLAMKKEESNSKLAVKREESNSKLAVKKEKGVIQASQWKLAHQIIAHTGNSYSGPAKNREITCIAVSDCNQYFASASADKKIKIWDARSFDLLRSLEGHTSWVLSVSFLGNKIVSGSYDNTIKIWEEKRCTSTLFLHSHWVLSVCVSSSKRLIASGSADETIRVFDIEHNRSIHTLKSHTSYVRSVLFFNGDKEIISGSDDRTINIWKTETGELLKTLNRHVGFVLCVRTSGELIVSSSLDTSIRAGETDVKNSLICLEEHTDGVTGLDVCNRIVASIGGGEDNTIRVWDLESRKQIQKLEGHGLSGICYIDFWVVGSLKILEEGRCIVSGGADGRIKVWRNRLSN